MDYPAYGGSWQRTVRDSGRVGSIFDSAGGKVAELADRDQPLPTDAQERQQQGIRTEGMFDPENDRKFRGATGKQRKYKGYLGVIDVLTKAGAV